MADDELPFRAEYAKSGRAACKGCKEKIDKDVLRMAVMVRSFHFDGKQPNWYHFMCFFARQRPKSVGDIAHFDSLRWEDQEKITKKIEANAGSSAPPETNGKKASKRSSKSAASNVPNLKDYTIQYSVSSRAVCIGCQTNIAKGEVRVAKKDYESEQALQFGGLDRWHHLECFSKLRGEMGFYECGSVLPGFKTLTKEDQKKVKEVVPKIKVKAEVKDEVDGEIPAKKIKHEPIVDEQKELMKKENKIIYNYRDSLKQLKKQELISLLQYNEQEIPEGNDRIWDRLSDAMAFGALAPCEHCKTGQLVFRSNVGFQCIGHLNEWAKCQKINLKPKRRKFKIPEDLKEKYAFLGKYKPKVSERHFEVRETSAAISIKSENGPKVDRFAPLKHMSFLLIGKLSKPIQDIKTQIVKLGGTVVNDVTDELAAVISTPEEIEKMKSKMMDAQSKGIQVVPESFIEEATKGEAIEKILKLNIASWGQDPKVRIEKMTKKNILKSQMSGKSKYLSSGPSKIKVTMKSGIVVDPDSGLEDVAHVYTHHGTAYTSILGLTDITQDKNSYYKLQILEADKSKRYWLFRSWGRIGTTIGGNKLENFLNVENAISQFETLYEERTGNCWENRKHFIKVPGKFNPIDVDFGGEEEAKLSTNSSVESKLAKPVQDLIKLLFDVDTMKKIMLEFELDLEKMPLGKLSRKQITEAYSALNSIQKLLQKRSAKDNKSQEIITETNKFYTLIPHNFGVEKPTVIDTDDLLKQKIDMLDSLMEIELAYSMLKSGKDDVKENVHPLDQHYTKLRSDIEVLDKENDEYRIIKRYVKNTHAATHNMYKLEIDEVFKVRRHGEDDRYQKFKDLHNRKLLWHGSRLTNFAGILSQGLRIAPPEAPATGYMFGKGIYFADMVSKSANYCMPSPVNCQGFLLLCQVALGDMYENRQAKYIEKLPSGKHSCKGIGLTEPDPAKTFKREDGVEIPLGKGVPGKIKDSALLYNEFIVYDVAQVKTEYLVKLKFKFD